MTGGGLQGADAGEAHRLSPREWVGNRGNRQERRSMVRVEIINSYHCSGKTQLKLLAFVER